MLYDNHCQISWHICAWDFTSCFDALRLDCSLMVLAPAHTLNSRSAVFCLQNKELPVKLYTLSKSSWLGHFMYLKVECFYMFLHRVVQRICLKWRFIQSLLESLIFFFVCFDQWEWRNHLTVRQRWWRCCLSWVKQSELDFGLLYCLKLCLHY